MSSWRESREITYFSSHVLLNVLETNLRLRTADKEEAAVREEISTRRSSGKESRETLLLLEFLNKQDACKEEDLMLPKDTIYILIKLVNCCYIERPTFVFHFSVGIGKKKQVDE